jgi:DNA-binding NarL/FixJ family response regulator
MAKQLARILVVEDEALVAQALELMLVEFGFSVVGPAPSTRRALFLIAAEAIDIALLDVNLGKERVDCVAEALASASIPFVFTTGYSGPSALPAAFRDRPAIYKPYPAEQLREVIGHLLKV